MTAICGWQKSQITALIKKLKKSNLVFAKTMLHNLINEIKNAEMKNQED
jgi:hypothetical protein